MTMLRMTPLRFLSAALCATAILVAAVLFPADRAIGEPRFQKVILVIFENTDYADAIKQKYFKSVADRGVHFTNFWAETHPSQGNYVALTSGDLQGIVSDRNYDLNVAHIGDLLEAKGKTWKVYAEGFPGNCYTRSSTGDYARKHVPFMSFINVTTNKGRCMKVTDEAEFDKDVAAGTLPNYSMYVPDQRNDGHDTGVRFADKWFEKKFGALLSSPDFMKDTLIMVTFDESGGGANQIYTSLYGPSVNAGMLNNARHDHYTLLRMIEDEWGLGNLGLMDKRASVPAGVFK